MNITIDGGDTNIGDCSCAGIFGLCYLRAAIQEANYHNPSDVINIPAGTYKLTGAAGDNKNMSGDLDIRGSLTINGAGAGSTIIDGNYLDRVFHVVVPVTVNISGVTIQNGYINDDGGGILVSSGSLALTDSVVTSNNGTTGGGIYAGQSTTTLTNTTVSSNHASPNSGGGIYSTEGGNLTVVNGTIIDNSADLLSGGIVNGGNATLITSIVSVNSGGIYNGGTLTLIDTTVINNQFGINNTSVAFLNDSTVSGNWGLGGILNEALLGNPAQLTVTNTTVSGNTTFFYSGGGIRNAGGSTATLANSTIVNNTAAAYNGWSGNGGGIANLGGTVNLKNTIVAGNADEIAPSDPDCFGALTSQGYNLIQTASPGCTVTGDTTGNVVGQGADLGPLAGNGGSTQTHALLEGSPAVDAGSPDCPPPDTDQRGNTRPWGRACDIGAYESTFVSTPTPTPTPSPSPSSTPSPTPVGQTPSPTITGQTPSPSSTAQTPTSTPASTPVGHTPTPTVTPTPSGQTPTGSPSSQTPSPTPTATATPPGTATPILSPTATAPALTASPTPPGEARVWGDSDCDEEVSSRDSQALLRNVLDQAPLSQEGDCPALGEAVMAAGAAQRMWGDWDCDGEISSRDSQALLRRVLSQPALAQTEPCPDIGVTVFVADS